MIIIYVGLGFGPNNSRIVGGTLSVQSNGGQNMWSYRFPYVDSYRDPRTALLQC